MSSLALTAAALVPGAAVAIFGAIFIAFRRHAKTMAAHEARALRAKSETVSRVHAPARR